MAAYIWLRLSTGNAFCHLSDCMHTALKVQTVQGNKVYGDRNAPPFLLWSPFSFPTQIILLRYL